MGSIPAAGIVTMGRPANKVGPRSLTGGVGGGGVNSMPGSIGNILNGAGTGSGNGVFSPLGTVGAGGGKAGKGGGAGGGMAGLPGATTNFSASNPDIDFASNALKERYSGDNGAGRAIDLALGKIRDSSEGQARAMAASRTARGVSGTGADDFDARALAGDTQRQQAGAASDIAFNSEQAKTGLLNSLVGAGTAKGNLGIGERSLALQQYQNQQQNQFQQEQAQRAQQMAILQLISSNL